MAIFKHGYEELVSYLSTLDGPRGFSFHAGVVGSRYSPIFKVAHYRVEPFPSLWPRSIYNHRFGSPP